MEPSDKNLIHANDYIIEDKIESSYLYVSYIAKRKDDNKTQFQAAIYNKPISSSDSKFLKQIELWSRINHPAVSKFVGYSMTDPKGNNFPMIVSDFYPNSNLSRLISNLRLNNSIPGWTATKKYIIILGIAFGLKYLHSQNIIFLSINPDCILLDENYHPKIYDFSLASYLDSENQEMLTGTNPSGLMSYMAPETLIDNKVTFLSNVYSYAILIYELLTLKSPYNSSLSQFKLVNEISQEKRPDLSLIQNDFICEFLPCLWGNDTNKRIPFDDVVDILIENYENKKIFLAEDLPNIDMDEIRTYIANIKNAEDGTTSTPSKISESPTEKIDETNNNSSSINILKQAINFEDNENLYEAAKLYKQAANNGDVNGMLLYGNCLETGKCVHESNLTEAAKMYKMAYEKDNSNTKAMIYYGSILENGCPEFPQNLTEAANLYRMAANKGNVNGMLYIGRAFELGRGVKQDFAEAAKYYKMAADAKNDDGMLLYGTMLERGQGVPQSQTEALHFYKLAAIAGNEIAPKLIEMIS
ncbi:hypothetical protein TRFO_39016 [Tritrichomonas foetus]|uniref:Protein kinase domain-containing protein n=1 Tax=Tritrichomonas foetus TaxID=1144522 RepID=A0A1J4J806_9EUKA|nr:hypothetical protein TRFO_39016 [Tritrichomonas foetus]|eukprot:OHS94801.1 hypothetical protein TRFO_39016 [Tritrichomonas foetus]